MNQISRRDVLAGSVSAFAGGVWAGRSAGASEAGFKPLFDGVSLQGWFTPEFPAGHNYSGGRWQVTDGCICGEQYPPGNRDGSMLLTEESFGDFELVLDVHPVWGCDSGVFLRSTTQGQCIQVMIDYLPGGSVGFLHGHGSGGFFCCPVELEAKAGGSGIDVVQKYDAVDKDGVTYAADAAAWRAAWRFDGWNTVRIRCTGRAPDITTWINDVKIVEMRSSTFRPRQLAEVRKQKWDAPSAYQPEAILKRLGTRGRIGLQVHPGNRWAQGGVVRFRNILVRNLG